MSSSSAPVRRLEDLYGRSQVLDKLSKRITRTSLQLLAERRMGKTSVLNCLLIQLRQHEDVIVMLIDWKSVYELTDSGFLTELLVKLIEQVLSNKLENTIQVGDIIISSPDVNTIRAKLIKQNYTDLSLAFNQLAHRINSLDIQLIYLFDEYEFLFLNVLDRQSCFYIIRSLTEKTLGDNRPALTYLISGNTKWSQFADTIGSPELNTIGAGFVYLGGIDQDAFSNLCLRLFNITKTPDWFEKLYREVGGLPFFAKLFANSGYNFVPDDIALFKVDIEPHLNSIYMNLSRDERALLSKYCNHRIKQKDRPRFIELINRGIIYLENDTVRFKIKLFEDYFNQKESDLLSGRNHSNEHLTNYRNRIRDEIKLINDIVKKRYSYSESFFSVSDEDPKLIDTLGTPVYNYDGLQSFASACYKIMRERTKVGKERMGALNKFTDINRNEIRDLDYVIELRNITQHYQGNYDERSDLTEAMLMDFFSVETWYTVPEEYYMIQEKCLEVLVNTLNKIRSRIKNKT